MKLDIHCDLNSFFFSTNLASFFAFVFFWWDINSSNLQVQARTKHLTSIASSVTSYALTPIKWSPIVVSIRNLTQFRRLASRSSRPVKVTINFYDFSDFIVRLFVYLRKHVEPKIQPWGTSSVKPQF